MTGTLMLGIGVVLVLLTMALGAERGGYDRVPCVTMPKRNHSAGASVSFDRGYTPQCGG